jgi:hypothetical protein
MFSIELEELSSQGFFHSFHEFLEPLLNFGFNLHRLDFNFFLLWGDQSCDFIGLVLASTISNCFQVVDTFENFLNVFVDRLWVLGLTNDLKQVIIREEIESGELSSLSFQELIQVLLNKLQLLVQLLESSNESFYNKGFDSISIFVDSLHLSLEDLINSIKSG